MPPPLDPLSTVRNGRVQFFSVFLYFMLFCNKKRMTQSFFIQLPSVSPDSILIGPLIRILMGHPPKASHSDTCTHTPTDTYTHTHNQNLIQPNTHTQNTHKDNIHRRSTHTPTLKHTQPYFGVYNILLDHRSARNYFFTCGRSNISPRPIFQTCVLGLWTRFSHRLYTHFNTPASENMRTGQPDNLLFVNPERDIGRTPSVVLGLHPKGCYAAIRFSHPLRVY